MYGVRVKMDMDSHFHLASVKVTHLETAPFTQTHTLIMFEGLWDEIQDSPGEIYDLETFHEQVAELREIMDKVVELESQSSDYGVGK